MYMKYFGGLLFVAAVLVVTSQAKEAKAKKAAEAVTKAVNLIYKAGGPERLLEATDKHNVTVSEKAKALLEKIKPYLDPSKLKSSDKDVQTRGKVLDDVTTAMAIRGINEAIDLVKASSLPVTVENVGKDIGKAFKDIGDFLG